jgi:hypothetical protein
MSSWLFLRSRWIERKFKLIRKQESRLVKTGAKRSLRLLLRPKPSCAGPRGGCCGPPNTQTLRLTSLKIDYAGPKKTS